MRTTLTLPDDVYEVARSFAHTKKVPLGDAVAELVRRAVRPSAHAPLNGGFPCFSVGPDAPPITLEKTLEMEDEV